jgi:putative peptidoglycan lipid II flippase
MNFRRIFNATLLVGAFFALDKVVAFGRQVLVARLYGVGAELDAYNAANNLPDTLYSLISGGALTVALIPLLTEARERAGQPGLWDFFSRVANLAFAVTAALSVGIAVLALPLVQYVVVPRFTAEQHLLVADLMRWNLLATLLFSLSSLLTGALQANQHFLLPALAPLMYNLGQIGGVLLLGPVRRLAETWGDVPVLGSVLNTLAAVSPDLGIYAFAYGAIIGAGLHLLVQLPGLPRVGFRWQPLFSLRDESVRRLLVIMGPRILTIACLSAIFIINDNLASGFNEGAISALAFGWVIMQLPQTVIGTASGIALLPTLGELVAQGRPAELTRLLRRALLIMFALTAAVTVGAGALLPFAANAVFPERADLVTQASELFMLGLVGHSIKEVTARTFYAHKDARTPLLTAAINLAVFVVLGVALTPVMGFAALALANSLSFTLEAGLMVLILRRRRIL